MENGGGRDGGGLSHLVLVSPNRKRKAAFQRLISGAVDRALQRAAREERLLVLVECDCAELLPVVDQRLLCQYLVDGKLALDR